MPISMHSLRSLPRKQLLIWALQEKAKRIQKERERQHRAAEFESLDPNACREASLVLDTSHPLSDLYYRASRYKVYWGGRASAKSWGVAEALIRKAAVMGIRVLCTREYQVSIQDSAHRILSDTIQRLGFSAFFTVTDKSIKSRAGAEFIFKGLHRNEQGIRSTEAIDICWVEEAQSVSRKSWKSLIPTIRKPGSEIWITFNLMDEDDATYSMFVKKPRPDSIVHKINYDSNPHFPEVLRVEMEADRLADYHLYEHIWLGMPLVISDDVIFARKYAIREWDEAATEALAERLFYGMDFGFSQDPQALLRFYPVENDYDGKRRLYVSHEAYDTHVELDDTAEWMKRVPGVEDWPIYADPARPETISFLARRGFRIEGADKWEGCVKDGITHLRGFDEIVIHPRCQGLSKEARLYKYKTDPRQVDEQGRAKVLPIIIDAHNHAWDAIRYGLNGYIQRSGTEHVWERWAELTQ